MSIKRPVRSIGKGEDCLILIHVSKENIIMSRVKPGRSFCHLFFRCCLWLLSGLFFISCEDDMPSSKEKDNGDPKISEVWVLQRVDISIIGGDGNRYSYSYSDRAHFDNEVERDTYPYNYYDQVFTAYAYVLFDDKRIEALALSTEYDEFKKNPDMFYPLSYKNVEYYRIEGNKIYIRTIYHWEYDLGEELAFYIKSNTKSSIVLEVYGDAVTGYFNFDVPQLAWPNTGREDSQYHYTAYYKKERR